MILPRRSAISNVFHICLFGGMMKEKKEYTFPEALRVIQDECPLAFRKAVRSTSCPLYRGEASFRYPSILSPAPDLLELETYGDKQALDYFQCLEEQIPSQIRVRPSTGHIGTSDKVEASKWGQAVSVWPIGFDFQYAFAENRAVLFPGGQCPDSSLVYNRDLDRALAEKKEVLFTTRSKDSRYADASFLVLPAQWDSRILSELTN